MARGRRRIISASRITASAIIFGFTMPTLSCCSGTATMLLGVASAPVPAVVGIITVNTFFLPRVGSVSSSRTVQLPSAVMEASLATSITLPPPTATIMSAPHSRKASTTFWAWSQVGSAGSSSKSLYSTPAACSRSSGRRAMPDAQIPLSVKTAALRCPAARRPRACMASAPLKTRRGI